MNLEQYDPNTFVNLPDDELIDTAFAASFLKVKPNTLAVWRCNRSCDLPYILIGRLPRYRVGDLRQFVLRNVIS